MTPATGNPRKFHKGPPPYGGWWHTQTLPGRTIRGWRWWNAEHERWSHKRDENASEEEVEDAIHDFTWRDEWQIEWSDYWPANARVPRINPNKETA